MTQRSLIALAVAGLLTLSAAFVSPERSVRVDDDDTKLALYMKDINKGLRGLRSTLREPERNAESIAAVRELQQRGLRPLCLGGDHSVSWPIVRSVARAHRRMCAAREGEIQGRCM